MLLCLGRIDWNDVRLCATLASWIGYVAQHQGDFFQGQQHGGGLCWFNSKAHFVEAAIGSDAQVQAGHFFVGVLELIGVPVDDLLYSFGVCGPRPDPLCSS